ncbi:MAG: right-handed parallel beta-helix repeat-containing protein, partial [Candidatus Desantisbacteria bacterium]
PGVEVRFAQYQSLWIGGNNSSDKGKLMADGTLGTITFTSNEVTHTKGSWRCIYFYDYSDDTSLLNNVVVEYGGEGYSANIRCNSASPSITNSLIGSSSVYGIYLDNSSPQILNNSIRNNDNIGIYCNNSSSAITNNTILRNNNHGIYCSNSSPAITNNIIVENGTTSASHYGIYKLSGNPAIDYNDVWNNGLGGTNSYFSCSAGAHDISLDPQFIGEGDYHLQSTSPCIDAGSNSACPVTKDLDGNPRILRIIDIGPYEFQGDFLQIRLLTPTEGPVGQIITVQGNTSATNTTITIDFGAKETITTTLSSALGTFSATFIVDNQPLGTTVITTTNILGNFATAIFVITEGQPATITLSANPSTIDADSG